ncbi:MAG: adenosylcobinamide-phosphate synthase CbiB [Coriobacteriales bacterium]|nr:adenosylcobinamide-phosphate synthase CbiB [Coriobacteriales bacterium]
MWHLAALACGFVLDALLGDPYNMPHIIRLIGSLIATCERVLRRMVPATQAGERAAGVVLVLVVAGTSTATAAALLRAAYRANPWLGFAAETFVCYQMLAAKQLRIEALRVYDALRCEGVHAARKTVSMIVGRDTQDLDEAGVVRAAVETVAENASDGVVAPLLFMALAGGAGGVLYKAVNTMDSMVGYKNERYRYFGTAAARLDDLLNFIPARLTGVLMCLVAPLAGLDGKGAWRVFVRDRLKHASPNSAHPEAACAGALGVHLAGPASYFGVVHNKPTIGDDLRPIEPEDIVRACRLLFATSLAALALCVALRVCALVG